MITINTAFNQAGEKALLKLSATTTYTIPMYQLVSRDAHRNLRRFIYRDTWQWRAMKAVFGPYGVSRSQA